MNYLQYPVLFESSESDFTTQGIGVLTDCLNVEVTNEFNELPELKLDYLATGDIANELVKDRIILADVGEGYLKQLFRIPWGHLPGIFIFCWFADYQACAVCLWQ